MSDKIWDHRLVKKTETCWLWTGCHNGQGYGQTKVDGKMRTVHRLSFLQSRGELHPSTHVLHKCDVPACLRPSHLFPGNHKINAADKTAKGRHHSQRKTHCPKGHPYSGKNLTVTPRGRQCKACQRAYRQANSLRISVWQREYRKNNVEKIKKMKHEYYMANRDK